MTSLVLTLALVGFCLMITAVPVLIVLAGAIMIVELRLIQLRRQEREMSNENADRPAHGSRCHGEAAQ